MLSTADQSQISPIWTIASTVATGVATVVLAWFGGLQLLRESKRESRAQRAAAARISAIAYRLQRQIAGILATKPRGPRNEIQTWIYERDIERLEQDIEALSARAHAMMDLLGDAEPRLANAVRRVFVLILEARRRMFEIVAMGEPSFRDVFEYTDLVKAAKKDLEQCLETLRLEVIERWLQNEEASVQRARYEDSSDAWFKQPFLEVEGPLQATEQLENRIAPGRTLFERARRAIWRLFPRKSEQRNTRDAGAYRDDESTGSE